MEGLNIQSDNKQIVISISKKSFDEGYLLRLIERMNLEYLAQKADFDKAIEKVGEEIKKEWWKNNSKNFKKNIKK